MWRNGLITIRDQQIKPDLPLQQFIDDYSQSHRFRIPGTAVFLSREAFQVPSALSVNLKHNKYLHEKLIFITLIGMDIPYYESGQPIHLKKITHNAYQVIVSSGFMEYIDMKSVIDWLNAQDLIQSDLDWSIFLSKDILVRRNKHIFTGLEEYLYLTLYSFAQDAVGFYYLPNDKVIELGIRYEG